MNNCLAFLLFGLALLPVNGSLAQIAEGFDKSWFENPGIAKGLSSCKDNKCTCDDQVLEWKDTRFRPKDTWVARTADKLIFLWNDFEKEHARYKLKFKRFEPSLKKFEEKGIGHSRKIKNKKEYLKRDYQKVQNTACKILNAQNFFNINYPLLKKEIRDKEGKELSSTEKSRLDFVKVSLSNSITKLNDKRLKITLNSPIVTGTYKEVQGKYVLPKVHNSWLQEPIGITNMNLKVSCNDIKCSCGNKKRVRVKNKPAEELRRVYLKGYLAGHWRKYHLSKKELNRWEMRKNENRIKKAHAKTEEKYCLLKLALHFINVLHKDYDQQLLSKYKIALKNTANNQSILNKKLNLPISKTFYKLKKAMIFYAQTSKDDHLLF